jgi:capsular polysaccharide biosynthesis protein
MEIRAYLKFLQRRWKIILPLFIATLAITTYLTMQIQPVYEASATYIVRINSASDEKNSISALNTLISSDDIPATYAKVANSRLIKRKAADQLGLSSSQRSGLSSNSQLIAGTNVIEVVAKGEDPVIVMDYANEVGEQMLQYASTLYGTYELITLDEAAQPRRPISPDIFTNLLLGAILGLSLGIGMALIIEYWQTSLLQSGGSNTFPLAAPQPELIEFAQFNATVNQALAASQISRKPVSVALLEVGISDNHSTGEVSEDMPKKMQGETWLPMIAKTLLPGLQSNDRICILDNSLLAIYMPDTGESLARLKINESVNNLENFVFSDDNPTLLNIDCVSGIVSYPGDNSPGGQTPGDHAQETMSAQQILELARVGMKPIKSPQTNKNRSKQIPITTSP